MKENTTIRRALPAEAAQITALALRSKAHWGYDAAFMAACTPMLTLTAEDIATLPTYVLLQDAELCGFYTLLARRPTKVELDMFFIDPAYIGCGYGRLLFDHAVATARTAGYTTMLIEADPHAASFYAHVGAYQVGERPSGIASERMLPLFRYDLE